MPLNILIIYMYILKEKLFCKKKNKGIFVQNEYFLGLKKLKSLKEDFPKLGNSIFNIYVKIISFVSI